MNKTELIAALAHKADLTKADAERAVNAYIAIIQSTVVSGDVVTVPGFGTFKSSARAARDGRIPRRARS